MSVSNNDFVTGENEGESLQTTEDSSTLAQSRVSTENESIVYALPKTYNGKTVTDLFPEFEHNKVFPKNSNSHFISSKNCILKLSFP
jgi:hypothetical protein